MRGFRHGGHLLAASGGEDCVAVVQRGLAAFEEQLGGQGRWLAPPTGEDWRALPASDGSAGRGRARHCVGQWDAPLRGTPAAAAGYNRAGPVMVALAGRFVNGASLRQRLRDDGAWMTTHTDAELLAHLLSRSDLGTPINRLVDALWRVEGGFAAVVMDEDRLVGVGDPWGLRALYLGWHGETAVLSDTVRGIEAAGARLERALDAGEMAIVEGGRCMMVRPFAKRVAPRAIQEDVGLDARPESVCREETLATRHAFGVSLGARCETPAGAVVVGMPGELSYAEGYASAADVRAVNAFALEPGSGWIALEESVHGRRVVLVADDLGNGDRIKVAAHALRVAGVREIHLRVARALESSVCGWEHAELGPQEDREDVNQLGVDGIAFLPHEAFPEGIAWSGTGPCGFCHACCGAVGTSLPKEDREQLPLFEG